MTRKAQQAQPRTEDTPADPLTEALAADPWDRTPEQSATILQAGMDVRLKSLAEDQRKLRERSA